MSPELIALRDAVLDWWKMHEYDTEGDYGEWNVFDSVPHFVKLAQDLKETTSEQRQEG